MFPKTCFVLSCPGLDEEAKGKPAAGATGDNIDRLLQKLSRLASTLFPSTDRYDYGINNSHPNVLPKVPNGKPTQPTRRSVSAAKNVDRLKRELKGCKRIIFMGERAAWARDSLTKVGFFEDRDSAGTKHPSNRGISSVKVTLEGEELEGAGLKDERLQVMAETIVNGLGGDASQ